VAIWCGRGEPTVPVIGVLDARSPDTTENTLRAFREGLKDTGYIAGENVALEYRSAEDQIDRLPALAADLVRRHNSGVTPTAARKVRKRERILAELR
jgi:putative tryptophan/tyrosine transport system substrate-binding protein